MAVKESGIKSIPANTVIMSFKLSIGKTAITVKPTYTNEAIMAFIPTGKYQIIPEYTYYLFSGKDWSEGSNKAVMGLTLNKATLSNIEIEVPSLKFQRNVIEKLDKISAVIALRKQQLAKLDELVKARFVEMFGDPKLNEKLWKINTFSDICTVRQGLQIPISKRLTVCGNNCYEYITVAYLHGSKEREYIQNPKSTVICSKDDILMTRTGNTGMVVTNVEGVFHNNFFLIDFDRERYNKVFLVSYLNLDLIQTEIRRKAGTSTIPDLNHGDFYTIPIYEPPMKLQNQFAAFVEKVDKCKLTIQTSRDKLEIVKKALMQKYFGQEMAC
ncbi:MAG: restriction endonuclease subunit S [Oscillospiraceae bacterium]|nr:restriction endonuclease subunit S [Oscillospiraceae bacterium]